MKKFLLLFLLLPLFCHASGYALYEMNAKAHGMAHAYICQVDDPSAVWYNPAALTKLEGDQVYVSTTWINTSGEFTPAATGVTINADSGNFFPFNAYYSHQFNSNVTMAFGVYNPFGLTTQWPDGSVASFASRKAQLRTYYFTPSLGYRITPNISIGGGLDIVHASTQLQRNILIPTVPVQVLDNKTRADTTDVGFNLGFLYDTNANLKFAVTYKNKIDLNLNGDTTFSGGGPGVEALFPDGNSNVQLPLPSQLMFGAATTYEKWTFEGDIIFAFWGTFQDLPIDYENNTPVLHDQVIQRNYSNSWSLRLGTQYMLNDSVALRGGYLYDETPVPLRAVDTILPDANRNGITFGIGWMNHEWAIDAAYMHLFFGDRISPLNNFLAPIAAGLYGQSANLLAFGAHYKF